MKTKIKNIPDSFTTREAEKLSGLSKSMLDYLVRTRLLTPTRTEQVAKRGAPRRYSFSDIIALRTIKELLEAGISVVRLRKSLEQLFKRHQEITPGKIPGRYLVTDGTDLFFLSRNEVLENLSRGGQLVFTFILEVRPIHDKLVNDIHETFGRKTA